MALLELTNESLTNKLRATKQTPQLACTRLSDCHFRLHFSFSDLQLGATFATSDLPVPRHGAFHPCPGMFDLLTSASRTSLILALRYRFEGTPKSIPTCPSSWLRSNECILCSKSILED